MSPNVKDILEQIVENAIRKTFKRIIKKASKGESLENLIE
jgi:hypothetical protein